MFGRFLEISLATPDITASVQFYERLGFVQLTTNDTWHHPYGALSDGHVSIGLHQRAAGTGPAALAGAPLLSFVHPDLARHALRLVQAGFEPREPHLGDEDFHRLELCDPGAQRIALLEARTFSPAPPRAGASQPESLCGWFSAYSMPALGNEAVCDFWERAGFVALDTQEVPFAHLPLTGDGLSLALHAPRTLPAPALVFTDPAMRVKLGALQDAGFAPAAGLPGLNPHENAVLEAPEGTVLLLLAAEP